MTTKLKLEERKRAALSTIKHIEVYEWHRFVLLKKESNAK